MSILLSWLSPLRTICMAIDQIAFSFLDNAYNVVISLSTVEFMTDEVTTITQDLYIIFGVVAFFRLAMLLVNSLIDPEKLAEKGKGLGSIFFRIVLMIVILGVCPFIFQIAYDVQGKIVGSDSQQNVIFQLFLGDNANISGYDDDGYNAGKALRNIVLSSLITIDKAYLVNDGAVCHYDDDGNVLDSDGNKVSDVNQDCGFVTLSCVATSSETCVNQGGYIYDEGVCDWKNCKEAVSTYNDMYVNENMEPYKLAGYVGVSTDIEDDDGVESEVYVYNYMMIITTAAGIFITYVILSFAIDIAVRIFELIVLQILSPLFIATFVDPQSAQSGPFKNWLNAIGKSYASLYIKLAILALMTYLLMFLNKSEIFDSFGDITGLAKIFTIIGLLIFAKKAPKWIMDIIGIKSEGGLGIGKKLSEMAGVGGLVKKGLDAGRKGISAGKKKLGESAIRRAQNTGLRVATGLGAHRNAMKKSKGSGDKYSKRLKNARLASKAARKDLAAEQLQQAPRSFEKVRSAYERGALLADPDYKSKREAEIEKATGKATATLEAAINANALQTEFARNELKKLRDEQKRAKIFSSGELEMDGNDRKKVLTSRGEEVYVNPQNEREINAAVNYATDIDSAYNALGQNLATAKGYTTDTSGRVIDSGGRVVASSMAELGVNSLSYAGQLALKEVVAQNVQSEVSNYKANKEQLAKSQQDYANNIQMLHSTEEQLRSSNPTVAAAYNDVETYQNQADIVEQAREKAVNLKTRLNQILNGRKFNDLSANEQARYEQVREQEKQANIDLATEQTTLKGMKKTYNAATAIITTAENQYGITQMKDNLKNSEGVMRAYQAEVQQAEDRFKNTSVVDYNEDGTVKKDNNGNPVMINPFKVKVNGAELSPKDDFIKIDEIINELQTKTSKASDKAKKKLDEELKKLEPVKNDN